MSSGAATATPDLARWSEVAAAFRDEHRQGEHVTVAGPNGMGKSVLLFEFAKLRGERLAKDGRHSRVTVCVTKPRDKTVDLLGWPHLKSWPPGYGQEHVIVWPPYGDPETVMTRQRRVFGPLLRTIFSEGGQTVVVDELARFSEKHPDGLGLSSLIRQYYTDARSSELSMFGATQRPTHVPRAVWSEPKWVAIFKIHDHDDLRRLVEIGGNTKEIFEIVNKLDDFEFLLIRRRGSKLELLVSKVELSR